MAINCIVGLMGHGKTYQCVKYVVVPMYKSGRNIVHNIEGLNEEEIRKYIIADDPKYDESNFGSLRSFTFEEAKKENFFPGDVDEDSFCKHGDLIIIDEAWKVFNRGEKLNSRTEEFLRKMRHYVDENHKDKPTCDLTLITQDHSLLNTGVKNLIEMLFVTKKAKSIWDKIYTVQIYEGNRATRKALISNTSLKYSPSIFPLYKSYAAAGAKETLMDTRVSFLKGKAFIFSMIVVVFFMFSGMYVLYDRFSKYNKKNVDGLSAQQSTNSVGSPDSSKSSGAKTAGTSTPTTPATNSVKRITGVLYANSTFVVYYKTEDGRLLASSNPVCYGQRKTMHCKIDNELISY